MSIMTEIQSGLKAPKGQTNAFGKYNYRSCEDIVEAVKPILKEKGCWLLISDEMEMLGNRYYVKATASVMKDAEVIATSSAFAREALEQKGMQESQLTGATSSYARKYALNGLFAIDDTKDADSQDNRGYQQVNPEPINHARVNACYDMLRDCVEADVEEVDWMRMQDGMARLTNDEKLACMGKFGDEKWKIDGKETRKKYKTVVSEYLKMTEADLAGE